MIAAHMRIAREREKWVRYDGASNLKGEDRIYASRVDVNDRTFFAQLSVSTNRFGDASGYQLYVGA